MGALKDNETFMRTNIEKTHEKNIQKLNKDKNLLIEKEMDSNLNQCSTRRIL